MAIPSTPRLTIELLRTTLAALRDRTRAVLGAAEKLEAAQARKCCDAAALKEFRLEVEAWYRDCEQLMRLLPLIPPTWLVKLEKLRPRWRGSPDWDTSLNMLLLSMKKDLDTVATCERLPIRETVVQDDDGRSGYYEADRPWSVGWWVWYPHLSEYSDHAESVIVPSDGGRHSGWKGPTEKTKKLLKFLEDGRTYDEAVGAKLTPSVEAARQAVMRARREYPELIPNLSKRDTV